MTLAGFASQSAAEVFLGYCMVFFFLLAIGLALHSLYEKIAKYFRALTNRNRVDITINEMYDDPYAKPSGPPHPTVEGKAKKNA